MSTTLSHNFRFQEDENEVITLQEVATAFEGGCHLYSLDGKYYFECISHADAWHHGYDNPYVDSGNEFLYQMAIQTIQQLPSTGNNVVYEISQSDFEKLTNNIYKIKWLDRSK